MREIKSRGKRVDNGEWVRGYYCFNGWTDKQKHLIYWLTKKRWAKCGDCIYNRQGKFINYCAIDLESKDGVCWSFKVMEGME